MGQLCGKSSKAGSESPGQQQQQQQQQSLLPGGAGEAPAPAASVSADRSEEMVQRADLGRAAAPGTEQTPVVAAVLRARLHSLEAACLAALEEQREHPEQGGERAAAAVAALQSFRRELLALYKSDGKPPAEQWRFSGDTDLLAGSGARAADEPLLKRGGKVSIGEGAEGTLLRPHQPPEGSVLHGEHVWLVDTGRAEGARLLRLEHRLAGCSPPPPGAEERRQQALAEQNSELMRLVQRRDGCLAAREVKGTLLAPPAQDKPAASRGTLSARRLIVVPRVDVEAYDFGPKKAQGGRGASTAVL
eukprot:TRINITY_DN10395_c0_g1_i1.p1 TRINITY_DN10395_c0_g1~~TRINITY_DN10395_c0_g1_i1.p1  ORF type:complete len:304 (+),score=102.06 TRINITY_DN10395_c0_g1_i1:75-986(+)